MNVRELKLKLMEMCDDAEVVLYDGEFKDYVTISSVYQDTSYEYNPVILCAGHLATPNWMVTD